MRVRLLGTAAGGGFPQWNCGCRNCRGVRDQTLRAVPRTQSSLAVTADGRRWFLINASPDVRLQIESFAPLRAADAIRGTAIEGVLLTSADIDHTLGLFILREGDRLVVHASPPIRQAVEEDLGAGKVLQCYCGIEWREPPAILMPLLDRGGSPSGLQYAAFPVAGKPPRYSQQSAPTAGDAIAYRIVDPATGGSIVCALGIATIDHAAMREFADCGILFLDGTFWSNDEMSDAGVGVTTASQMGHLPVGGSEGSLARIAGQIPGHLVYVHINNTNPMLIDDSPQRRLIEEAGAVVGADGMEFNL